MLRWVQLLLAGDLCFARTVVPNRSPRVRSFAQFTPTARSFPLPPSLRPHFLPMWAAVGRQFASDGCASATGSGGVLPLGVLIKGRGCGSRTGFTDGRPEGEFTGFATTTTSPLAEWVRAVCASVAVM